MTKNFFPYKKDNDFLKSFSNIRESLDSFFSDFHDSFFELPKILEKKIAKDIIKTDANLSETDNCYKVTMELSGVDRDDIDIEYQDGLLTVKAEKKEEKEDKNEDFYRKECSYGTVERSFSLPNNVKEDTIKADYNNGVLKIKIEKNGNKPKKTKKINIE